MTATPELGKCRGCGMPIVFAKTEKGGTIPLSPLRRLYTIEGGVAKPFGTVFDADVYCSHFEVCCKASAFSGRNRRGA